MAVLALAAGAILGMTVFSGTAYAPPGAAPVQIADRDDPGQLAAVGGDGALKVDGDVTAAVSGSVSVSNFPSTQNVQEQNVDGNGYIAVHEQGTANVNVTNESLSVEGDVTAAPPVATSARNLIISLSAGEQSVLNFSTIDATAVSFINFDDDEMTFCLRNGGIANFCIGGGEDEWGPTVAYTFGVPLRTNSAVLFCLNESEDCEGNAWLAGLPPTP